jgi:hypothetical protein
MVVCLSARGLPVRRSRRVRLVDVVAAATLPIALLWLVGVGVR